MKEKKINPEKQSNFYSQYLFTEPEGGGKAVVPTARSSELIWCWEQSFSLKTKQVEPEMAVSRLSPVMPF